MRLTDCHNFADFRRLAKKRLPGPIFHYIDGAADDEVTYRRNTEAYETVDLVPNVLNGVDASDPLVYHVTEKESRPRSLHEGLGSSLRAPVPFSANRLHS